MSNVDVVVHVVDDEEAVRNSLAFLLGANGFAVRTHASAAAFLEIASGIRNGCLVTDLRMPEIDGVDLLRRLGAAGAMLPAIVVTGHGDVQMAVEAMKNGDGESVSVAPGSGHRVRIALPQGCEGAFVARFV